MYLVEGVAYHMSVAGIVGNDLDSDHVARPPTDNFAFCGECGMTHDSEVDCTAPDASPIDLGALTSPAT